MTVLLFALVVALTALAIYNLVSQTEKMLYGKLVTMAVKGIFAIYLAMSILESLLNAVIGSLSMG